MVRTRIAPSPTGDAHIGTIYQALFNFSFAKKKDGHFVVRIEDTDRTRFVPGAEEKIYGYLEWFSLSENESPRKGGPFAPYKQSERLKIYYQYAHELVKSDHAYYCFCTPERLAALREKQIKEGSPTSMYDKHCRNLSVVDVSTLLEEKKPHVIRLKVPEHTKIIVHDEIRGDIEFESTTIDDQVLLKSDNFPTYHLAVVIDDHLMEITHVVRGEEWITSAPKHVLLYEFFGWKKPLFYHTPVLRNPDHSKLSKRHGHTAVDWYREEGFLPEAILNFLALMGWSHPEGKEIFSLDEFIKLFELKDLKPVGPIFDLKKLEWMNGEYIRNLEAKSLKSKVLEYDPSVHEIISDEVLDKLILIAQTRMKTLKEFYPLIVPFLKPEKIELNSEEKSLQQKLKDDLEKVHDWNLENLQSLLFETYIKPKVANFKTLYKIIIGTDRGLPLADTFAALGKEATIALFEK